MRRTYSLPTPLLGPLPVFRITLDLITPWLVRQIIATETYQ